MSIFSTNIKSYNISQLENNVSISSAKIQELIETFSDQNNISFDQTTKQNISISFYNQRYRFEIQKPENKVFMYQVWKKNNEKLNLDRKYKYISLTDWISLFNSKSNFKPTTLIEINSIFYPSVLTGAAIENNSCVFYFETTEIENIQNILPKNGTYNNVRFDIDSIDSPTQNLINLMISPILESLNIQTISLPPLNIDPIHIPVNESGGLFMIDVYASDFSVFITNLKNLNVNFKRYYGTKYLEFTTTLSCYINIGTLNFTGTKCLLESYEDSKFTNIKVPFNLNINLKFDRTDVSKSTVTATLPDGRINFDQSMTNYWNDYWNYRISVANDLAEAGDAVAVITLGLGAPAAVYYNALKYALEKVNDEFMEKLNSEADFNKQINDNMRTILSSVNSYFSDPMVVDIYNKYKYLIDILFQSNTSQWDFGPILCVDTQYLYMNGGFDVRGCENIASQNYAFVTTDTPFSGTNFPTNQIYIVKTSDYSSCYALNMQKTTFDVFSYIPRFNISGYEPASVLIKTDDSDGTLELSKPVIYGFYENIEKTAFLTIEPGMNVNNVLLIDQNNRNIYITGTIIQNGGFYTGFQVSYTQNINDNININPPLIRNYKYIDSKTLKEIETNAIFNIILHNT